MGIEQAVANNERSELSEHRWMSAAAEAFSAAQDKDPPTGGDAEFLLPAQNLENAFNKRFLIFCYIRRRIEVNKKYEKTFKK